VKSVEQQFKKYAAHTWPGEGRTVLNALRHAFDAGRRSVKAEQRRQAKARGNMARKGARHEP
jgi:hypothetical protein